MLSPTALAERAIDIARRAARPVALEPARYTAIFTPAAVAQLVRAMHYAYMTYFIEQNISPFATRASGKREVLGRRVFDARVRFVSDPADPDGGYPPFIDARRILGATAGFPLQRMMWVDGGVLESLAYEIGDALAKGRQSHPSPQSVRLSAMPGTETHTLDEMVAGCTHGILVNRLSGVEVVDWRSGLMTGFTRDGCFLVRSGRIEKSVKNFRFTASPFLALNNLEAIGTSQRAALGHMDTDEWPLGPVIVPPIMVRDFQFMALTDAV